jgi:hypothetical protein
MITTLSIDILGPVAADEDHDAPVSGGIDLPLREDIRPADHPADDIAYELQRTK